MWHSRISQITQSATKYQMEHIFFAFLSSGVPQVAHEPPRENG